MSDPQVSNPWYVYLIRCANGHLYTGVTTDPQRRLAEHRGEQGKGAKFLKGKGPLTLVWQQPVTDRSSALKAEYFIKQLTKSDKELIVNRQLSVDEVIGG